MNIRAFRNHLAAVFGMAFLVLPFSSWATPIIEVSDPRSPGIQPILAFMKNSDFPDRFAIVVYNDMATTATGKLAGRKRADWNEDDQLFAEIAQAELGPWESATFVLSSDSFGEPDPGDYHSIDLSFECQFVPPNWRTPRKQVLQIDAFLYLEQPRHASPVGPVIPQWSWAWNMGGWGDSLPGIAIWSPDVERDVLTSEGVRELAAQKQRYPSIVFDPGFEAFPVNPGLLGWATAVFLDGLDTASLNAAQRKALEIWTAMGGILLLDSKAFRGLGDCPLTRGVSVGAEPKRKVDLYNLVPVTMLEKPNVQGQQRNMGAVIGPGRAFASVDEKEGPPRNPLAPEMPDSRPPPEYLPAVNLKAEESLPGKIALGEGPDLLAWRFGAGYVAVQSFEGLGDKQTASRWVRLLHERRQPVANISSMFTAVKWEYPGSWLSRMLSGGDRGKSPYSLKSFIEMAARLPFAWSQTFEPPGRVMIGVGVYLIAAAVLFLVFRLFKRRSWREMLFVQCLVLCAAGVAIALAARGPEIAARTLELVMPLPDSPWEYRFEEADFYSFGAGNVSVKSADGKAWSNLRSSNERLFPDVTEEGDPVPPIRWDAPRELAFEEAHDASLRTVERRTGGVVESELRFTSDTLRGTFTNNSRYALKDTVFVRIARDGRKYFARLPRRFEPGDTANVTPWKPPSFSGGSVAVLSAPPHVPAPGESAFDPKQGSWAFQLDGQTPFPPHILNAGDLSRNFAAIIGWVEEPEKAGQSLAIDPAPTIMKRRVLYCQPVFFEQDPPTGPPAKKAAESAGSESMLDLHISRLRSARE